MRQAGEEDEKRILQYLQKGLSDCVYLYIDIMNYGVASDNLIVWVGEKQNNLNLVVMKYYDSFQIYSHDCSFDVEEVTRLLEDNPVKMISGSKTIIEKLSKRCVDYHATYGVVFVMDRFHRMEDNALVTLATTEDCKEIAELICSDEEIGGHYSVDGLRGQLEERIEAKTGRSYIVRENGRIVAHSATYAEADGIAVVGGTIIHPEYRNSNYYIILSNYMMQQLENENKRAYTFSISEKMIRYHKRPHTVCGEYGKLVKQNNKQYRLKEKN